MNQQYKVVPFIAVINGRKGEKSVAEQLQSLIDAHLKDGWQYIRLESVPTVYNDAGCFGFGAKSTQNFNHLVIFKTQ